MSKAPVARFGLVLLTAALLALPAMADSQARIVRLSDVQGIVQIDKNTGLGFENAFLNLPITQGTQLKTGDRGRAEIEFEDGSTLRLTPNTLVESSTLGSSDAGKHQSVVNLTEGMAYINWLGKSGDQFSINFSHEKIALDRAAHFRVSTSTETAKVAVFKGEVDVNGPSSQVAIGKKKTATFDTADNDKSTVADNIEEAPLDSWDKESIAYHDQYSKNNSSPYGYGVSDLNYYGAYSNVPGYGMMWQPYFTGVGWDPFMDGAWSFYPGYGYMFASAYPWGWMPYRYGNWAFVPGFGWMWQPGNWNNWGTVPHITGTTPVHFHALAAPSTGTVKTVAVGRGGTVSTMAPSRMVLNAGSAGMGIPRGSLGNLGHLNHQVARNGFAEVHAAPQFGATSGRAPSFGPASHPSSSAPHSTMSGSSMGHASAAPHASGGSVHH
jgi:hypothetical protein